MYKTKFVGHYAQIVRLTIYCSKTSRIKITKLTSFSKLISSSLIFNFFFGLSSISNNLLLTFKILLISCLRLTGAPSRFPGSTAENIMPRFGEWNAAGRGHGRFSGVCPLSCPKILFLGLRSSFQRFLDWFESLEFTLIREKTRIIIEIRYSRAIHVTVVHYFYFLSMAVFTTGPSYESKLMNNYLAEAESVSLLSGNSNIRNRN